MHAYRIQHYDTSNNLVTIKRVVSGIAGSLQLAANITERRRYVLVLRIAP